MGDSDAGEAGARERRAVGRHEWESILKRARLNGLIGGKAGRVEGKGGRGGVAGTTVRAIAMVWASHADGDTGLNVIVGDATVAIETETSLRTVKLVKAKFVALGLLRRTRAGARRKGDPDRYQLTIPSDLLDLLEVLTPAQVRLAAERMNEANRGKRKESGGHHTDDEPGSDMRSPEDTTLPAHNADVRDPEDTTHAEPADGHEVSSGPAPDGCAGSSGPVVRSPEDPPTNHDQPENLTNPSDGDLRTDLAVVRAPASVQDRIGLGVSQFAALAPWSARAADGGPERCEHGMAIVHRATDGQLACPACRRGIPAAPAAANPDVEAGRLRGRLLERPWYAPSSPAPAATPSQPTGEKLADVLPFRRVTA